MTTTTERSAPVLRPPARPRNVALIVLIVGVAVALPLVVLLGAWALDSVLGGDQTQRNVYIVGHDVGGKSKAALAPVLDDVGQEIAATKVHLELPNTTLDSTAADLGLQLDRERTAQSVMSVGDDDPLPLRPVAWLRSFFAHRNADVHLAVDQDRLATELDRLESQISTPPVEPTLTYQEDEVVATPGQEGVGLDAVEVGEALSTVDHVSDGAVTVTVTTSPLRPSIDLKDVQAVAAAVNANTEDPIPVVIGEQAEEIPGDALRRLVRLDATGKSVTLDGDGTMELLDELFPDVGEAPVDATLSIGDGGTVIVQEGRNGTVCCDPASIGGLAAALLSGQTPVPLALMTEAPDWTAESVSKLGIIEPVASFTTNHAAGQARVQNIHRIADIVSGAIIGPDETFSVNDYVGPRTAANGFVPAPIIGENGYFTDELGGGVSQFATTLFNAAFFAGLEITEYQPHGIYISRYPYGREATLDYGNIDLKIHNNTPYGVLIWPSYGESSITVTLYSTHSIDAEQSDQTSAPYSAVCTQVTTTRKRTYVDTGQVELDKFYATYTPDEGVECDGTKLTNPNEPEPPATTPSTAAPDSSTTAAPAPPDSAPADSTAPPQSAAAAEPPSPTSSAPS